MAEATEGGGEGHGGKVSLKQQLFGNVPNQIFRLIRRGTGVPFRQKIAAGKGIRSLTTFKDLDRVVPFKPLLTGNDLMWNLEKDWEGIGLTGEHPSRQESLDQMNINIAELYYSDKEKDNLKQSLGPFTSSQGIKKEGDLTASGTDSEKINDKNFRVIIRDKPVEFPFHLPTEEEIMWPEVIREISYTANGKKIQENDVKVNLSDGTLYYEEKQGNVIRRVSVEEQEKKIQRSYKVCFFGTQGARRLKQLINEDINKIINDALQERLKGVVDVNQKSILMVTSNEIRTVYETLLADIINEYTGDEKFDDNHRSAFDGGGSVAGIPNKIKQRIDSEIVGNKKLKPDRVHYFHTYNQIKRIKPQDIPELQSVSLATKNKDIYCTFERRGARKNSNPGRVGYEADWGLDCNGWPLEVANDVYEFVFEEDYDPETNHLKTKKIRFEPGSVLIDIFEREEDIKHNNKVLRELKKKPENRNLSDEQIRGSNETEFREPTKVRLVPLKFIEQMDPLETICYINAHIDSMRDDLRDGRYHKHSISLNEVLLAELHSSKFGVPIIDELIQDIRHHTSEKLDDKGEPVTPGVPLDIELLKQGIHAKALIRPNIFERNGTIKVKAGLEEYENLQKTLVETISPTHLNPAFDFRALELLHHTQGLSTLNTIHMGRKLYYETQDNTTHSDKPTITTRGAALYIVHKVIEEIRQWDEIQRMFAEIGEETHGYDIGPNLERWGKQLTRNPFRPF